MFSTFDCTTRPLRASNRVVPLFVLTIGLLGSFVCWGQTSPAAQTPSSAPAALIAPTNLWRSLTPTQQQALSPLASQWDALSDGQKRKWLAIAQNYAKLAPAEQEKMHSRMVEWASLSAKDREQARLNFAKTKTVSGTDRASNWEAYQALSEEEKKKLAASAAAHPAGAAVAAKPVPQDKLAIIPVPRSNAATPKNGMTKAPAPSASAPQPADASPSKAP